MAQLRLKQLDSVLTGSLKVSGSAQITGSLYVSASIFGEGLGLGDTVPSSPATDLHIKSDTPVITLQRTNNNQKSAIDFQGSAGSVGASIEFVVDNNDLSFQTFDGSNIHEKLRLEDGASGNVKVSGSTQITGSLYVSSSLYGDGSQLSGITSGIFQTTGSVESATATLQISGSLLVSGSTLTVRTGTDSGAITASTAIFTNNITNGYPTSNAWQESLEGSYFNNFDNTTHVSEILRFMDTKTFASVDTNDNSLGNTDTIGGYLPQEHASLSNATIDYLNFKDWWRTGGTCFSGLTVYYQNGATHYLDFDSNSGGSTSVRSSADTELFGLGGLTSGGATAFNVQVHATQSSGTR